MGNIFKNAEFGDKYLTRDGRIALFTQFDNIVDGDGNISKNIAYCYTVQDGECPHLLNGKSCDDDGNTCNYELSYDIVSRYQETIDEEKLDGLAEKEEFSRLIVDNLYEYTGYEGYKIKALMKDMYKAGYRKAMGE